MILISLPLFPIACDSIYAWLAQTSSRLFLAHDLAQTPPNSSFLSNKRIGLNYDNVLNFKPFLYALSESNLTTIVLHRIYLPEGPNQQ